MTAGEWCAEKQCVGRKGSGRRLYGRRVRLRKKRMKARLRLPVRFVFIPVPHRYRKFYQGLVH